MKRHSRYRSISLWQVVQSMQERMEAQGLSAAVVDALVTQGLERLLRQAPGGPVSDSP